MRKQTGTNQQSKSKIIDRPLSSDKSNTGSALPKVQSTNRSGKGLSSNIEISNKIHSEAPKNKVLIAIVNCHVNTEKANAQRETWIKELPVGVEHKFFLGKTSKKKIPQPDEVFLPVNDDYLGLPSKTSAICEWALVNGYEYLVKVDDDVYLRGDRLMESGFYGKDYVGRLRGPSGEFSNPYCSGFTYILSRKAMKAVVETEIRDVAEDRFVGNALYNAGIIASPDYRFVIIKSSRNAKSGTEGPRSGNSVISAGELNPEDMGHIHQEFLSTPSRLKNCSSDGRFQSVSVLVKTFLRDAHLFLTVHEIEQFLPGAKIIVVDDGYESKKKIEEYSKLRFRGHDCLWLPFDSGFCAKSNAGVAVLDRPYLLIASDDFEFNQKTSDGVARMLDVLEDDPSLGVASGKVDGRNYQGFIEHGENYIKEISLIPTGSMSTQAGTKYDYCDITVNYCLVRREVFEGQFVAWDEEYKIGGDHFEFFDQINADGWRVAIVSGVNINQRKYNRSMEHDQYRKYRGRAKDSLPRFFKKYGLKRYIAFDGREDILLDTGEIISKPPPPESRAPLNTGIVGLHKAVKSTQHGTFVTSERLYLSHGGEIVLADNPGRKTLFAAKGTRVSIAVAKKYGLIMEESNG